MELTIRAANHRGHANHGWLDSRHTFSFGDYYDPQHMGFRTLRVINDDRIAPASGFPTHPHRDMEILTYVLRGELAHRDSMGFGSIIRPGQIQRMSAGRGITHSEYNASDTEELHLLQIWIKPEQLGLQPSYQEKELPRGTREGNLHLIASRDGGDNAVVIHQDVRVYASILEPGQQVRHDLAGGRHSWIQIARGEVDVNGAVLRQGDGGHGSGAQSLVITGRAPAELLLFDLA